MTHRMELASPERPRKGHTDVVGTQGGPYVDSMLETPEGVSTRTENVHLVEEEKESKKATERLNNGADLGPAMAPGESVSHGQGRGGTLGRYTGMSRSIIRLASPENGQSF